MTTNVLVINKSETHYLKKYRLFSEDQDAVDYVNNELEWGKFSWLGKLTVEELKVGVCCMIDAGDFGVEVIKIEITPGK